MLEEGLVKVLIEALIERHIGLSPRGAVGEMHCGAHFDLHGQIGGEINLDHAVAVVSNGESLVRVQEHLRCALLLLHKFSNAT